MKTNEWRRRRSAVALGLSVLIAACGGGGGDGIDDGSVANASSASAAEPAFVLGLPPLSIPSGQETVRCADASIGALSLDTVFVPDGTSCQLNGTRLRGTIIVGSAATLEAVGVQVTGNLQAEGASSIKVGASSAFGGSVQIKQGDAAQIVGTAIGGDLQFDAQRGALRAQDNRIGGNLQAVGNRGGVELIDNRMNGNLQCKENAPAPTGGGNTAALKEDQCVAL
jgi:hypothetical protein